MRNKVRLALVGLLIGAGFALAPSAFARGHVNVGVSIGLPGLSLGYSDCRHCYGGGYGVGYVGGGYGGGYYAPAPVYYSPAPVYYGPTYYDAGYNSYPVYRSSYYNAGPVRRGRYDGGRYDRRDHHDRRDGRRASYYDRGGYRH